MRLERPIAAGLLAVAGYVTYVTQESGCESKVNFLNNGEVAVCKEDEGLRVTARNGASVFIPDLCIPELVLGGRNGVVKYYLTYPYHVIRKIVDINTGEVITDHYAVPIRMEERNCPSE